MKKIVLAPFLCGLILLMASWFFFSCKKSDNPTLNSFTWAFNGTFHIGNQDTAFIYSRGPHIIFGGTGTNYFSYSTRFYFSLTSFDVGTYTFGNGSNNTMRYFDEAGDDLDGISGKLNITASTGNLLSGNFSGTLINTLGVSKPVSGSFANMPVLP